ncbi:MAG TPA: cytochrome b5 domain-containing protein [Geopsychrobacteraceae bacterium]|nr:cytochrome b5 domain-containing protein [Geopsychrobacteraceae bacterium]
MMTVAELAKYDGRNNQPAYVAVNEVIYDVSESPMWQDGNHLDQHQAGQDLTEDLKRAPHVRKVIERFPTVGRLEIPSEPAAAKKPMIITIGIAILLLLFWLVMR